MTEQEWLACADPAPMLRFLHGKVSDRQLRLFITNYCRRNWHLLEDERYREAIELAERFAEGNADEIELMQIYGEMWRIQTQDLDAVEGDEWQSILSTPDSIVADSCRRAVRPPSRLTPRIIGIAAQNFVVIKERTSGEYCREAEHQIQVDYLRDILGPLPFRPCSIAPAWRTSTVVSLAQSIYDQLQFEMMSILADALEESGCDNAEILAHSRRPGVHVKGCWVVDLILGKM